MAVLVACEALPVRVRGDDNRDIDPLPDVVIEACDAIAIACEPARRNYGSVIIDMVHTTDGVRGRAFESRCSPVIRSIPKSPEIAHELGHILGLEHRKDDDAAMHPTMPGLDFTDDEIDTAEREADRIVGCRP